MIIKKQENLFVQIAERLGISLDLKGEESIFDSEEDCIEHHSFEHLKKGDT